MAGLISPDPRRSSRTNDEGPAVWPVLHHSWAWCWRSGSRLERHREQDSADAVGDLLVALVDVDLREHHVRGADRRRAVDQRDDGTVADLDADGCALGGRELGTVRLQRLRCGDPLAGHDVIQQHLLDGRYTEGEDCLVDVLLLVVLLAGEVDDE